MSNFLLQTLILVSYLISLFIIIHFLFSREGGYWIIPLLLNLYFVLDQSIVTINANGGKLPFNVDAFTISSKFFNTTNGYYVLFGISILWLLLVLSFHNAFKNHKKPVDKRREMMKKNYYAAIYTEKMEKRAYKNRMKRRELDRLYGTRKPLLTDFSKEWIDKFDRR